MRKFVILASLLTLVLPVVVSADTLTKEVSIGASSITAQPFQVVFGSKKWSVPAAQVKLWFKTRKLNDGTSVLQLRPGAIYDYLNVYISPKINTLGTNSRFQTIKGVTHLVEGGKKGQIVDGIKTSLAIRAALIAGQNNVVVRMKEYRPILFSAEDFKKLQFPTLLTRAETNFTGSPKNRVHNITVGTQQYNGVVIMPNQEFSFNSYLGAVDAEHGYLPELVIKEHVTTPEFGGGICQVSTTTFRAAMTAGLKITARHNHAYVVHYYGAPGFDATVYVPSPDLRFINDTGKPILFKTSVTGSKVVFELWGTNDGRQVTINGPFTTEKKPDGSLTAAVAQVVKKNGKTIREDNFVSKYQSPDKFPKVLKANGG